MDALNRYNEIVRITTPHLHLFSNDYPMLDYKCNESLEQVLDSVGKQMGYEELLEPLTMKLRLLNNEDPYDVYSNAEVMDSLKSLGYNGSNVWDDFAYFVNVLFASRREVIYAGLKAKVDAMHCDPPQRKRGRPNKYETDDDRHKAKILQNHASRQRVLERRKSGFDEALKLAITNGASREELEKINGKRLLNCALKRLNLTL
jgi:hypothetical protein